MVHHHVGPSGSSVAAITIAYPQRTIFPRRKIRGLRPSETGNWEVYVSPFPGFTSKWQVSRGGGEEPRWRGDGKELFYLSPDGTLMAVEVKTGCGFEAGSPSVLFQTHPRQPISAMDFFSYDVTSDGQKFLVNRKVDSSNSAAAVRDPELVIRDGEVTKGRFVHPCVLWCPLWLTKFKCLNHRAHGVHKGSRSLAISKPFLFAEKSGPESSAFGSCLQDGTSVLPGWSCRRRSSLSRLANPRERSAAGCGPAFVSSVGKSAGCRSTLHRTGIPTLLSRVQRSRTVLADL